MQNRKTHTTLLLAATGVLFVGAFGFGYGLRESRMDDQRLSDLARRTSAIDARIQATTTRVRVAHDQLVAARSEAAKPSPPEAAAPPKHPSDLASVLAGDAKLNALYFKSYRADMAMRCSPLFRRLKLTADQSERLLGLMTQAAQDISDLQAAAVAQGLAPDDASVASLSRQVSTRLGEAEAQIIGPESASLLQQVDSLRPAYAFVDDFARMTAMGPEPISGDQALSLMKVVKDASPASADGGFEATQMDRDKVLSGAAAFLTPGQLATLSDDTAVIPVLSQIHEFYVNRAK